MEVFSDNTASGLHFGKPAKWHALHWRYLLSGQADLEHKNDLVEGFTKRYGVHELVWYELHETMESAIVREKALKRWKRQWKLALIEKTNPAWEDLYPSLA